MYGKSYYVAPFEGGLGHASPHIPLLVSGSVYNQAVGGEYRACYSVSHGENSTHVWSMLVASHYRPYIEL